MVGTCSRGFRRSAFTLIEAVLALAISGVVLAAIGGVFYGALRLRNRSVAILDEGARIQPVLSMIKRDLAGAMPPEGVLASNFRCGALDTLAGGGMGIQFVTTTGPVDAGSGWGDLQEVTYALRDSTYGGRGRKDLVRSVNRNLLATTIELPREELLLEGVELFQVECFDGLQWRNSWDTSLTETNLPYAVRIELRFAAVEALDGAGSATTPPNPSPIELIVPLHIQSRTNLPADSAGEEDPGQP